jgi:hypothetical protein
MSNKQNKKKNKNDVKKKNTSQGSQRVKADWLQGTHGGSIISDEYILSDEQLKELKQFSKKRRKLLRVRHVMPEAKAPILPSKRTRISGFPCISGIDKHALCEGSGCASASPVALNDLCEKCKMDILYHVGYLFLGMMSAIVTHNAPSATYLIMANCTYMELRSTKNTVSVRHLISAPEDLQPSKCMPVIMNESSLIQS